MKKPEIKKILSEKLHEVLKVHRAVKELDNKLEVIGNDLIYILNHLSIKDRDE